MSLCLHLWRWNTDIRTNMCFCVCIYGDGIQTLGQISVFVFVFMEMETHALMSYGRRLFPVRQCWQLQSMIPIPLLWIDKKKQNQRGNYFRLIFTIYPLLWINKKTKPATRLFHIYIYHLSPFMDIYRTKPATRIVLDFYLVL